MKTKRNLSGMYFRFNEENICFEDLPESEQGKILDSKEGQFVKGIAKHLANILNDIGEQLDIIQE